MTPDPKGKGGPAGRIEPALATPPADAAPETPAPGPATETVVDESALVEFLLAEPAFFDRHADLLARLRLPDAAGGRVVSLHQRQLEVLRDRERELERQLNALVTLGRENDAIAARLQGFTRELLLTRQAADMPATVLGCLQSRFQVPLVAMRLWPVIEPCQQQAVAIPVDEASRELADGLLTPFCGLRRDHPQAAWLDDADSARSLALLALRRGADSKAFGLLVLASPDPDRFQAGMGTDFLERIAETASAALTRVIRDGDDPAPTG
ncbi:MAG: DUF484 family protein [Burkholderiaceae bacterium]